MNLLLGTLLLAYLLAFCAYICWDVHEECVFQSGECAREELLDRLWDDGPPRAENRDAVKPTEGMGSF
jgi:hypothetical protein